MAAGANERDKKQKHHRGMRIIRNVYLYLVSMIGLVVFIFGLVGSINNVFLNYIFQVNDFAYIDPYMAGKGGFCAQKYPDPADAEGKKMLTPTAQGIEECKKLEKWQQEQNRRNNIGREFSISIAQLAVGLPIWLFHWGIIQKEYRRKEDELEIKN